MRVEREKRGQLRGLRSGGVGLRPRRSRGAAFAGPERPTTQCTDQRRRTQPLSDKPSDGPRIVTLDIETAPLQSYHWGLWDQNIGLEQIGHEWSILSVAWKWLGESKVHQVDTGGRGLREVRDDSKLLASVWQVLDEADIVIGQNAKAFDVRKINARLLLAGFRPYSPIKIIDTMLAAKKHFDLTSNKLQWLSRHLTPAKKSEHKKFPGFELWSECLKDNPSAWAEMAHYNRADVVATEQLYLRLRPWIEGHPNVAAYSSLESMACPACGSTKLQMRGRSLTQAGEYHRYQCTACGRWARSRYTLNTVAKRKLLLTN